MKSQTHKINLILILLFSVVYIFDIGCPFHKITGLYCPGCGMTRCIESLFKLEIYQAFRYNSLGLILIILFAIYIIYYYVSKFLNRSIKKIPDWFIYLLVVISLLFGILRNIDLFSWLAPTLIN